MPQSFFGFWDIWSCLTIRKFWWCFFVLIMFDMLMEILPDCGGLPMDNPLIVCENSSFQCQSFLDLVPKDRIWKLSLSGNDLSGRFQRRTCRSFLPGSDAPDSPCLVAKSERNPCCCEIRGASFEWWVILWKFWRFWPHIFSSKVGWCLLSTSSADFSYKHRLFHALSRVVSQKACKGGVIACRSWRIGHKFNLWRILKSLFRLLC